MVVVAVAGNDSLDVTRHADVTDYLNAEYGVYGYKFVGASFETPGGTAGVITVSTTGHDDSGLLGPGPLPAPPPARLLRPGGRWPVHVRRAA